MMNKLTLIITALFLSISFGAWSQTDQPTTGTAEANFSILKKKVEKSNEQVDDEKKNSTAKFWLKRAEIMHDVYNLNRQFLQPGVPKLHVTLFYPNFKERKEWTAGTDSYEELIYDFISITLKNGFVEKFDEKIILYEDPLPEAVRSLEKAQELDVDGKLDKKIREQYDLLKIDFDRQAREKFFVDDFKGSHLSFAMVDKINEKEIMEGAVDDTLLFFAGLTASKAGLDEECIKYYRKAIDAGYGDQNIHIYLSQKYREMEDTLMGVQVLKEAHEIYPDNQGILIELINHYLLGGQSEQALEYLDLAKKDDPNNKSFLFAEATLYEGMGDVGRARELYERCIELDPTYFDAYYNIGVTYFNEAVELYKIADRIQDINEYDAKMNEAAGILELAKPYMEKAHELKPRERVTIETLRTIYRRLKMFDMSDAMQALIDELDAEGTSTGSEIQ